METSNTKLLCTVLHPLYCCVLQPGSTLVMAKKGVPVLGQPDKRGDQLVKVQVEIPKALTDGERDLIQKLADLSGTKSASVL